MVVCPPNFARFSFFCVTKGIYVAYETYNATKGPLDLNKPPLSVLLRASSTKRPPFDGLEFGQQLFDPNHSVIEIIHFSLFRCATMCLLATLCVFYPRWTFFFQMSMTIDIACHWIHLHTSLLKGSHHKFVDGSGNPIMRIYYTNKPVLFIMCAGNGKPFLLTAEVKLAIITIILPKV